MRVGVLAVLLLACGPPPRAQSDGGGDAGVGPDAAVNTEYNTENPPQCGNGVLDEYEYCDDGPLNGTSSSHCTKQCASPVVLAFSVNCEPIPAPLATFVNGGDFIAAIAIGLPGIQTFPSSEQGLSTGNIAFESHGSGTATSITMGEFAHFTSNNLLPIWVERDAAGAQHLYWLDRRTGDSVEIPYPFPQGSGGVLTGNRTFVPALLDIDPATHELLIAIIAPVRESDVRLHVYKLPAPGASLGAVAAALASPDLANDTITTPTDHRFLVFASENNNWVQVDVRQYEYDTYAENNEYDVTLESRGTWPTHVIAALGWLEGAAETRVATPLTVALSHPSPFAIETTDGSIYTWQFAADPVGETFLTPLGHVPPGSVLEWAGGTAGVGKYPIEGLLSLAPDGSMTAMWDGDPTAVNSPGLAIQALPVAPTDTRFAVARPEGNFPDIRHLGAANEFCYLADDY